MPGGPIIIIDPNKVVSSYGQSETVARLRQAADELESGERSQQSPDEIGIEIEE